MIKVIMLDLGNTLIDSANRPFPHVEDALAAIAEFKTAAGKPLRSCLVSDFTMAPPPATAAKITAIFRDYLALLDQCGLRSHFEPVEKRVTLSTQAGVLKPERRIFEVALRRLGSRAAMDECLFISENAAHLQKARTSFKMTTLQFRSAGARQFDFEDWAQAPALIAHRLGGKSFANWQSAVRIFLAAQKIELVSATETAAGGSIPFSGKAWHPLAVPEIRELHDLQTAAPVTGTLARDNNGKLSVAALTTPSAEDLAETAAFVRSLAAQKQIGGLGGVSPPRPTHEIQTDASGVRRLVRKRFSAR